jgi:pimeloyl-ACP methyl ester carboxylesterase
MAYLNQVARNHHSWRRLLKQKGASSLSKGSDMNSYSSISDLLFSHCRHSRQRLAAFWPMLAMSGVMLFFGEGCFRSPEKQKGGKFPEQLVYARSTDDVVNAGMLFTSTNASGRSVAVIWIHGWGVNFYQPTYVRIGRATAERGYAFISGNTRMHDLGNVTAWRDGKRIRAGGYWGVAGEEVRDLAARVDFAEDRGFKHVVLVGHSAGWAAVRSYPHRCGARLGRGAARDQADRS